MASKQKTPAEQAQTLIVRRRIEKAAGIVLTGLGAAELAVLAANKLIAHQVPLTEKEYIIGAAIGAVVFVGGIVGLYDSIRTEKKYNALLRHEYGRSIAEKWTEVSKKDKDLYI